MSEQKKCPGCGHRVTLRTDGHLPKHSRSVGSGAKAKSVPCPMSGVAYSTASAGAKIATSVRRYHDLVAENQKAIGCALVRMDPNCYRSQEEYEEAAKLLIGLRQQGFNVTMVQSQYPGLAHPDTWGVLVNGQNYFVHGAELVSLDTLNARVSGGSAGTALAKAVADGTVPTFLTNPPPQFAQP